MNSKLYTCERCGKPAQICHHKKYLDDQNVNDPTVALSVENLEALCIECHNAEHGIRHDITVFDSSGNVVTVKENVGTKNYQIQRAQIDDVVERARALLCGLNKNDVTEAP